MDLHFSRSIFITLVDKCGGISSLLQAIFGHQICCAER